MRIAYADVMNTVIIGGTKGIGAAIAKQAAEAGTAIWQVDGGMSQM